MGKAVLAFAFTLLAVSGAANADVTDHKTNKKIYSLAFDPDRNFWGEGEPFVTVVHRGDDWGVPVYSLGVAEIDGKFIARIVRSSLSDAEDRPRAAGYRLYSTVGAAKAKGESELITLFDSGAVEWLEADMDSCPGASDAITTIHASNWTVYPDASWERKFGNSDNNTPIVLHADTIQVRYHSYLQQIEYSGWFSGGDDHVSTAVLNLEKALKDCWKPSTSKAPWHRKRPRD